MLAVIAVLALVVVGLSVAGSIDSKATEESRWQDSSKNSCAVMLALTGGAGEAETMTVSETGRITDLPSYRVDGGTVKGQPVYCLNFISGVDNEVGASHVCVTDGGGKVV